MQIHIFDWGLWIRSKIRTPRANYHDFKSWLQQQEAKLRWLTYCVFSIIKLCTFVFKNISNFLPIQWLKFSRNRIWVELEWAKSFCVLSNPTLVLFQNNWWPYIDFQGERVLYIYNTWIIARGAPEPSMFWINWFCSRFVAVPGSVPVFLAIWEGIPWNETR